MKIIQITDPHLYGSADVRLRGVQTDASLRAVLDEIATTVPQFTAMLVTGDLVQDDTAGYLRFRSILGHFEQPLLCIPGNHDDPDAMRRELDCPPFRVGGTHDFGAWTFIMLDSYRHGSVGGFLSDEELARLDAALSRLDAAARLDVAARLGSGARHGADARHGAAARHAMVCLHHHPVPMHSRWLDTSGLANADEFWRVIDSHTSTRAVTWGHVHQPYDGSRGRIGLFATPSTGAQFLPHSERYAVDTRPPAYRSFELHADGRIETRVHWLESTYMQRAAAR